MFIEELEPFLLPLIEGFEWFVWMHRAERYPPMPVMDSKTNRSLVAAVGGLFLVCSLLVAPICYLLVEDDDIE